MAVDGGLWKDIKPWLQPLDPQRIEDDLGLGVPDVNHKLGWLELKYKVEWPKRERTPLRLQHYTKEQKLWARRRIAAGGDVKLLLRVDNDLLLFWGHQAAEQLGQHCRADLIDFAIGHWPFRGKVWKRELMQRVSLPLPAQLRLDDIWKRR